MFERLLEARAMAEARLPGHARWLDGLVVWRFEHSSWYRLQPGDSDAGGLEDDDRLPGLRVFGEVYHDGGSSPLIGLHLPDGAVLGVDIESPEPVFPFNTSLDAFCRTFLLLDRVLSTGGPVPADLRHEVERIDPVAYATSDWSGLLDHVASLTGHDPE